MEIYLAGPWARREEVREARKAFLAADISVNAQWLDVELKPNAGDTAESQAAAGYDMSEEASRDLADIAMSDAMVVMNLEKSEGKAVEQGIALATRMPLIIVGKRTNVFQYLPEVFLVDSVEEAVQLVRNIAGIQAEEEVVGG